MAYLKKSDLRWLVFTLITAIAFLFGLIFKEHVNISFHYIKIYLFVLVFCIGTNTNFKELVTCLVNKKRIIFCTILLRLLFVPAISFLYSKFFGLNQSFFIGMIFLSIVPSAMIASVFSKIFGGDININLLATFFMMILAPITVPFLSLIYLHSVVKVDIFNMFYNLIINLILPLFLGILPNRLIPNEGRLRSNLDNVMVLAVGMLIMSITSNSYQLILSKQVIEIVLVLTLFYITVFALSKKLIEKTLQTNSREFIAVRNELSLNDCALSSVLSASHGAIAAVPSAIAAILQIICIAFMNVITKKSIYTKKMGYGDDKRSV